MELSRLARDNRQGVAHTYVHLNDPATLVQDIGDDVRVCRGAVREHLLDRSTS